MTTRGMKHEDPRNINPETPPRHHSDGALCMPAVMHADCPLNHTYYRVPMTPNEKRWWYVELMLEELAALESDEYKTLVIDDVYRAEDGLVHSVWGTTDSWHMVGELPDTRGMFLRTGMHPCIIGDV